MKKIKLSALVLVALLFCAMVYVACSKQEESVLTDSTEFENPMDFIGQYHNKGLEYVLQKYPHSEFSKKSFQDTINQITTLLNDFIKTIPSESILNNSIINYKWVTETISQRFIDIKYNKIKSSRDQLSEKQLSYVDRLKKLLKDKEELDSITVFKYVSRLENEIWKSNMTENEKYVTLTATSVGKYSWKFWSQNNLLSSKSPQSLKEAVIEGDIMGAIAGMIGGCIGGAVVGTFIMPGVGSLTGCMLEAVSLGFQGAVLGSTVSALKYLIFD